MRTSSLVTSALACLALLFVAGPATADDEKPKPKGVSLTEAGLVTFFAGYAWAAGTGAIYRDSSGRVMGSMFVPVVGPIQAVRSEKVDGQTLLTGRAIELTGANDCGGDAVICPAALLFLPFALAEYAMFYAGPVIQATGLVLTLVGLTKDEPAARDRANVAAAPRPERTRPRVSVTPTVASGVGLSLAITQW